MKIYIIMKKQGTFLIQQIYMAIILVLAEV